MTYRPERIKISAKREEIFRRAYSLDKPKVSKSAMTSGNVLKTTEKTTDE